ncbi:MAG: glycosyltransferase family 1 protein [Patescibacteria group bacterium]
MLLRIDASRFGHEYATGVEMYSFHIIRAILREIARDKHCGIDEVVLYTPRVISSRELGGDFAFCRQRVIAPGPLWTQWKLSREMLRCPPDVLFVPSHTLPVIHPKKSVVMIHDVAFKRFHKAYSFFQYAYLQFSTWLAVRCASKILVPSDATRDDLIDFFACNTSKIEVVPHGFSPLAITPADEEKTLEQFSLIPGDRYFLFVGRLEEKKNLVRLVRAFVKFRELHPEFRLILAGGRGVGFRALFDEVKSLNAWSSVTMPGYVTEEEKSVLLQRCTGFVFPSLYEGFGMPILEAFSFGKPVLSSRSGSLPEVCGDSAILVDPMDEVEIFDGLEKLISGRITAELNDKMAAQLRKFDWDKAAQRTLSVLKNLI